MPEVPNQKDIRWLQRFDNFQRAFTRLTEAATLAKQRKLSELEEQGLIRVFEFTHELAWNTLKDFLASRGTVKIYGSKNATREAFAAGLIVNGEAWMKMIEHRNATSHTYDQTVANAMVKSILANYVAEFREFQRAFLELQKKERS